jgi:quinol monooxygenase YgiN
MICLAVTYLILPNRESEAVAFLQKLTPAARAEPGCRMFQAHRSLADPRRFFIYEQYDDQAALDAHRASPHYDSYVQRGMFKILETRTPELYQPLTD